jgi:HPt (histidine-containing phosphotransfer) domain-containing protein
MLKGALSRLAKMGGRDLALELLERFLQEAPQRLEEARQALQGGDRHKLQLNLHRICSDAGWLGASEVQSLANELEVRAQSGELEGFGQQLEQLSELCYETCIQMEQEKVGMLETSSKEGQTPASAKADG